MDCGFALKLGGDTVAETLGDDWRFAIADCFVDDGVRDDDLAGVAIHHKDGTGVIAVLTAAVEALPVHGFMTLLMHEIAHAIVGPDEQHGPAWEAKFTELSGPYRD